MVLPHFYYFLELLKPAQEQLRSLRGEMQEQRLTAAEAWKEGCLKIFFLI